MSELVALAVGRPYPVDIPKNNAAFAQFLTGNTNTLIIVLSDMNDDERNALKKGILVGYLIYESGAMLLIFQFWGFGGKPLLEFECPFDVRLIQRDLLQLPSIDNQEQRLLIDIHVIDQDNIVQVLRAVTMPPEMTIAFLMAAQEQLAESNNGNATMSGWMACSTAQLMQKAQRWQLGT